MIKIKNYINFVFLSVKRYIKRIYIFLCENEKMIQIIFVLIYYMLFYFELIKIENLIKFLIILIIISLYLLLRKFIIIIFQYFIELQYNKIYDINNNFSLSYTIFLYKSFKEKNYNEEIHKLLNFNDLTEKKKENIYMILKKNFYLLKIIIFIYYFTNLFFFIIIYGLKNFYLIFLKKLNNFFKRDFFFRKIIYIIIEDLILNPIIKFYELFYYLIELIQTKNLLQIIFIRIEGLIFSILITTNIINYMNELFNLNLIKWIFILYFFLLIYINIILKSLSKLYFWGIIRKRYKLSLLGNFIEKYFLFFEHFNNFYIQENINDITLNYKICDGYFTNNKEHNLFIEILLSEFEYIKYEEKNKLNIMYCYYLFSKISILWKLKINLFKYWYLLNMLREKNINDIFLINRINELYEKEKDILNIINIFFWNLKKLINDKDKAELVELYDNEFVYYNEYFGDFRFFLDYDLFNNNNSEEYWKNLEEKFIFFQFYLKNNNYDFNWKDKNYLILIEYFYFDIYEIKKEVNDIYNKYLNESSDYLFYKTNEIRNYEQEMNIKNYIKNLKKIWKKN